jgi:drug/metabolite transporter (DMT)-like permease
MMMLSGMLLLVKIAGESGIALPEIMFWRQFMPCALVFAGLLVTGGLGRLRTGRMGRHAVRSVIGTTNMFFVLGSVQLLPLSEATVLNFTTPLFAVLLSALWLREKVGPWRSAAVALGMAGVLIIVGFDTAELPALGVALGIAGAMGGALVAIQVRQLSRTEEPVRVVFWFSAFGAAFLSPGLLLTATPHDSGQWLLLAGIGASGLAAQIGMTAALRFGPVSSVVVMDYSQLFWATLLGWLVYAHLPPASTWIGAPIIIAAGLVVAWREHRLRRPATSPSSAETD